MGVSPSLMLRTTFVGGLASMGICLMWMAATHPLTHPRHIRPLVSAIELSLPPALASGVLPLPAPIEIARPAAAPAHRSGTAETALHLVHYRGAIHNSLFEAAMAQGVPVALLGEMIKIFSYDVDFQRDIQPDDQFELIYRQGQDKKTPRQLIYASLTLSGEPLSLYRYVDQQGNADFYSHTGESARKALLKTPVDGAKISSGFGMRFHPILHYTTQHKGIDFAVMTGTPVMAAGSGVVDYAGVNGAYGIYVRIKHDTSHSTAYAHLSRLAPGVRVGKHVNQGQTIALSGATGRATGPHLHYEMLVNDAQANPMSVKFQSGRKLSGKELSRFQASQRQTSAWLAQTPLTTRTARDN